MLLIDLWGRKPVFSLSLTFTGIALIVSAFIEVVIFSCIYFCHIFSFSHLHRSCPLWCLCHCHCRLFTILSSYSLITSIIIFTEVVKISEQVCQKSSPFPFVSNPPHWNLIHIHHNNCNNWIQNKAAKNVLIYVAKNTVSACFGIVFIYTAELLPTTVRWIQW